jgi:hypothetical protein
MKTSEAETAGERNVSQLVGAEYVALLRETREG